MTRLSQLFSLLWFLWAGNGSILDPNGEPRPTTGSSGDNGSGLEPNGRRDATAGRAPLCPAPSCFV